MIVVSDSSGPSARLLRDKLEDYGPRLLVSRKPIRGKKVHVNYGGTEPNIECEHNSVEFVKLCSNKKAFCDALLKSGVKSIPYKVGIPSIFPCVVRESLYLCGGRGIHVVTSEEEYGKGEFNPKWNWSPFVRCRAEFRVHVLGGKVCKVAKKTFTKDGDEDAFPIRSHLRGYVFKEIKQWEKWGKLQQFVSSLVKALPMKSSFVGLDLGFVDADIPYWICFEGNSAPGLTDSTAALYAKYLAEDAKVF